MTNARPKYILKPSLRDTLRRMEVGEEMVIPATDFRSEVVRNSARMLKAEGYDFFVSVKGERTDTRVTRTK